MCSPATAATSDVCKNDAQAEGAAVARWKRRFFGCAFSIASGAGEGGAERLEPKAARDAAAC